MEIPGINSSATVSVSDNGQSEQTVGVSEHPDRSGDVSVNT